MANTDHTDAELRRAYGECALVAMTFEQAMDNRALAIAIRLKADSNRLRQLRQLKRVQYDYKLAQANDHD